MSESKTTVTGDTPLHCPANNSKHDTKKPGGLRSIFKKCAACAGSGAGGLVAGHLGCILIPAAAAITGAAGLATGLGIAFGIAATAGGMYVWHRLRGKTAGKWEKRVVIGGAIVGLALSSAFNFLGGRHEHHKQSGITPQENVDTVKTAVPPVKKCPNGCCGR